MQRKRPPGKTVRKWKPPQVFLFFFFSLCSFSARLVRLLPAHYCYCFLCPVFALFLPTKLATSQSVC